LSSNENPYPPLPGVLEAAVQAAEAMNRYPDMFATDLVAKIAEHHDVPMGNVATGTGSVGVLQQIVQSTVSEGDEVVYAWRSFEAYPIVVGISGATSVRVPLTPDARHDLGAMADAITTRTRLVLVCSPNNPTGPAVHRDEFEAFMARVPEDCLVVVDEAYRQFITDPDAVVGSDYFHRYTNLCYLRSFSKAYGLAGLRVGYAVAHDAIADALRKTAVPFGVSGIAQRAAIESLGRWDELKERVATLVAERQRVRSELIAQGWDVPQAEGNFVWLALGDKTADFVRRCEEAGLIVRPFVGEGCRVTVAEPEANDRLLQLTADW
jgi:histidinol-phosphate aminotransferase